MAPDVWGYFTKLITVCGLCFIVTGKFLYYLNIIFAICLIAPGKLYTLFYKGVVACLITNSNSELAQVTNM